MLFGGRIDSIPYHARYFAPGRVEEYDELHQDNRTNRMNCIRTIWRIGWIHQIILIQNSYWAKQGIKSILPPKQQRRPLPSLLSFCFFYGKVYQIKVSWPTLSPAANLSQAIVMISCITLIYKSSLWQVKIIFLLK